MLMQNVYHFLSKLLKNVRLKKTAKKKNVNHVLVVTQMPGERAADIARLAEIAEEVFGPDRVDVRESLADAVDRAAEIAEAGAEPADRSGVLVFGSVMLAGEMLALAGHSPR